MRRAVPPLRGGRRRSTAVPGEPVQDPARRRHADDRTHGHRSHPEVRMKRRLVLALLALILVAAGCSDDKKASPSASANGSSSSAENVLNILVSNDDGVGAAGIDALVQ